MLRFGSLSVYARSEQYDPTRTLSLRRSFSAEMYKRFRPLKGVIRKAIIDQDVLGLSQIRVQQQELTPPGHQAYAFARSEDKIEQFMEWLQDQENKGILEKRLMPQIGRAAEQPWTNIYIQSAYRQGVDRANAEMRAAGYNVPDIESQGGLDAVLNQPFHADRLGLLYTRTFRELKGVTDAMDQQISRILAEGMAEGRHPRELARQINDRVDKIGLTRARTLARTETIRAHHGAMVQEYKNWEVEGVKVKAEWDTAGDGRVCELCRPLDGQIFTIEEIEPMIPRHPNCRCISLPVDESEVEETQAIQTNPWDEDPVASRFIDSAAQVAYMGKLQEYRDWFDDTIEPGQLKTFAKAAFSRRVEQEERRTYLKVADTISEKMEEEFPYMWAGIYNWQISTWKDRPIIMKLAAVDVEEPSPMLWRSRFVDMEIESHQERYKANLEAFKLEYVKLRAFNQAYMEKRRIKKVKLYRGTDGRKGMEIRDQLKREGLQRNKFSLQDAPLAGYTDKKRVANSFGKSVGGITVEMNVEARDVVLHKELLSGITNSFQDEAEFLVRGGKFIVDRKQIFMKDK